MRRYCQGMVRRGEGVIDYRNTFWKVGYGQDINHKLCLAIWRIIVNVARSSVVRKRVYCEQHRQEGMMKIDNATAPVDK